MVHLLDEVGSDRVGESVDHLLEDVIGLYELDRGRLLGSPHGLPASPKGVLVFCNKLVEMGKEVGQLALDINDAGVMVIGHRGGEDDPDPVLFGGDSEAIDESVVRVGVGAQEEPPLRTTSRD